MTKTISHSRIGIITNDDAAIDRAKIRLEGLSSYAVIAVLLMNSALRLYTAIPKKITSKDSKDYNKIENIATWAFSFFSVLSIVTGTNTAIIYSLLNLYSKTALGMGKDAAFIEFFASTADLRTCGFQSMVVSLISFQVSIVFSVFLYFKDKSRYILTFSSGIASFLSIMIWNAVIQKGSILFL